MHGDSRKNCRNRGRFFLAEKSIAKNFAVHSFAHTNLRGFSRTRRKLPSLVLEVMHGIGFFLSIRAN
jgi:hypothetical protein